MADQNLEKYTNTNPLQKMFLDRFFSSIEELFNSIEQKDSVLDVGCGEGFTIRKLQAKHPARYVGIDPDVDALRFAKEKDTTSTYQEGSIFQLPFTDNAFDVLLCNEVLEHLSEPEKALKELERVTKKHLIVSVPHEPLFRLSNLIRGRNITRWGNYPFHLQTWTKSSFKKFIATKFRIEQVKTPFPWTLIHAKKQ